MTTTLEKCLAGIGISTEEAAKRMGIKYVHVWRHCTGRRRVTADYAMRYHRALGIPLHELRPDLWPAPEDASAPAPQEARDGTAE